MRRISSLTNMHCVSGLLLYVWVWVCFVLNFENSYFLKLQKIQSESIIYCTYLVKEVYVVTCYLNKGFCQTNVTFPSV